MIRFFDDSINGQSTIISLSSVVSKSLANYRQRKNLRKALNKRELINNDEWGCIVGPTPNPKKSMSNPQNDSTGPIYSATGPNLDRGLLLDKVDCRVCFIRFSGNVRSLTFAGVYALAGLYRLQIGKALL